MNVTSCIFQHLQDKENMSCKQNNNNYRAVNKYLIGKLETRVST